MLRRWSQAWREGRDERILRERAIPEPLWAAVLSRYPFLQRRSAGDLAELRRLATLFLARKEFTGAGGLAVDDGIAVAIAMQACVPVLRLGLEAYDGFVGIVVHPDEVVAPREVMDEDGIVHAYEETLTGEAVDGGPVMLSWRDVDEAGDTAEIGYNVVIHEFAHVLDMRNGEADGVPLLPDAAAVRQWLAVLGPAYEAFCAALDADPDLETVIDPYGAEAPEEFFAVASEAFFVNPLALRDAHPRLYALLQGYYRQDPAAGTDG
ncbi:M90 family metallopeptidase [Piscinibacter sakaiensis]|uniref:M90 family metallopeptidase n=1 Tax=Piscinibacter sakaiensis TaxID=1547922 RepID=UPI0006B4B61C|nr:M90 family metallopeptidase [Piscinibacter sakaiensis]